MPVTSNELRFKHVTPANWLNGDPAWTGFAMTTEAWLNGLTDVSLKLSVPLSVRRLFEVARGTMAYSLMFYPLMTVGAEQLFRVVETAVAEMLGDGCEAPASLFAEDRLAS
ncbi:MAG: hypothetical protein EPO08_04480 [Rhodospirillaceae bacterium]|nr:MAG: hypothetical protein EPO08_04480 [Rhodospirillaceae bacterium]